MDINGREMGSLYRFLKRQSPLFVPKKGRCERIKEPYCKFLCDRYGRVTQFYTSDSTIDKMIGDVEEQLNEKFEEKTYQDLLDPPTTSFF